MEADKVLSIARTAIDTPFLHQGRLVGVGLDCAGLVTYILDTLGIPYNDQVGYSRRPYDGLIKSTLDTQPNLIRVDSAKAGDFILMKFFNEPQHLAVCAGDTIIHAWQTVGKVCEHRFDHIWKKRLVASYRINWQEIRE